MRIKKRNIFVKAFILMLIFVMTLPTYAINNEEIDSRRASPFISSIVSSTTSDGNGQLTVSYYVACIGILDEIGASKVQIYRKNNNGSTTLAATFAFDPDSIYYESGMTGFDVGHYSNQIQYRGTHGMDYYAVITAYARDGSVSDTETVTTNTATA